MTDRTITLDVSGLADTQRVFAAWRHLLNDPSVLLHDIGEHLLLTTDERFERREAPDGTPWDTRISAAYAERKQTGRATKRSARSRNPADLLELTGDLRGLIFPDVNGNELTIAPHASAAVYGAVHQLGLNGNPARPFLGVSDEDEAAIRALVQDHLNL